MSEIKKSILIDADIARASGGIEASDKRSKDCTNFLILVRDKKYKALFSPKISSEWNKHQSKFSATWRTSMISKNLVNFKTKDTDTELEDDINTNSDSKDIIPIMLKDLHLLVVSLQTNEKIIFSLDNKVRGHFSKISSSIEKIKEIIWTNPSKDEEKVIEWLNKGLEIEENRFLCN